MAWRRLTAICMIAAAFAAGSAPAQAVVGGKPAPPGTFPYVADIFIGGVFGCSGTLIAPQWVVTAGHCGSATGSTSDGLAPSPASWPNSFYTVQLGTVYADGHGGETHAVSQVVVDSDYMVTNGSGNDVTLLKLDQPTRIKPMPIASAGERSSWRPGVLSTIAGFGLTSQNDQNPPPQMQYAHVPITTDAYCAQAYPNGFPNDGSFDPSTMLCAGYPQGGTDSCSGDSGGPLLVPVGHDFRLVGATSFGAGCGQPGKPGVYARVAEGPIRTFIARFVPQAFAPEPKPGAKPKPKRHKKHHKKHHKPHRGQRR